MKVGQEQICIHRGAVFEQGETECPNPGSGI
jgi:hypothetical protein